MIIATSHGNTQNIHGLPIIKNYSPLEYGSHRQNWDIDQAPNGTMYFANGKGILSFNGVEWKLTMVPNRGHVRSLAIDDEGTVYVGANNDFGKLVVNAQGELEFVSFLPLIDSTDHNFGRVRKTLTTPHGVYFQSYHRIFLVRNGEVKVWRFSSICYRAFWVNNQLYALDMEKGLLLLQGEDFELVENGTFFKNKQVTAILPFGNNLLIGSRNEGFFLYDNKKITPFKTEVDQLMTNFSMYEGMLSSRNKIILTTAVNKGLFILDQNGKLEEIINQSKGLASNDIMTIFEDRQSALWVGMQEGIARIDIDGPYSRYDDRLGLKGTIQSMLVKDNQIYAASSEGLIQIERSQDNYVFSKIEGIDSYCWDLQLWNDQLVIACTHGVYTVENQRLTAIQGRSVFAAGMYKSTYDSLAMLIAVDNGFIYQKWDGTKWGEVGRISGISGAVRDIIEDKEGEYWLKTRSNGIFRVKIPKKNDQFIFQEPIILHYNEDKGVPSGENNIFRVNNLFLVRSELDSLYQYDRTADRFFNTNVLGENLEIEDGLVLPKKNKTNGELWLDYFKGGRKYLIRARERLDGTYALEYYPSSSKMYHFKDPYGNEGFFGDAQNVWFSSMQGILQVNLEKLKQDADPVPVLITKVQNNGQILYAPGIENRNYTLAYRQNDLSFQFSAPIYQHAENLQYATQLEGYDQHWSEWTSMAHASYTNLPEGKYQFKVKAKNDFDEESEVVTYAFSISPPWYRSQLAIVAYVLLGGCLIWLVAYLRSTKLRQEQARLEQIVRERTEEIKMQAEEINELYQVKNRFLANISHELRTPLTLILGPVEQMLASAKKDPEKQQLSWMYKNSQKLLKLINQLLDLSKIEAGKLTLKSSQQDLVQFAQYICSAFESLARQKNVKLLFKAQSEQLFLYFDPEKLEHIVNNLLHNALKFTEKGSVTLKVKETSQDGQAFAMIEVSDTGMGIHPQQLPHVFDRFFQARQEDNLANQGTGIGLALCKELVDLHSGKIEVESELGKGSVFSVFLPMGKDHLKEEEIVVQTEFLAEIEEPVLAPSTKFTVQNQTDKNLPLVLLVDDNLDMLDYIHLQLQKDFRFLKAQDGNEGLRVAQQELPDLIVSDVMMPGMSGLELCAKIKSDIKTDHIPVILLTARIGEDEKIQGLQSQADEYLQKPFNGKELQVRIQNLIESRKRLRKRFAEKVIFKASEIAETPQEALFLQQLIDAIETHFGDARFDVNQLCNIMAMSKSQLNRKMRAVLNKSPNQFIRSYRLERSRELIKSGQNTIAEIAYDVGFTSPAYFTKCFHDEFGYPPSEEG